MEYHYIKDSKLRELMNSARGEREVITAKESSNDKMKSVSEDRRKQTYDRKERKNDEINKRDVIVVRKKKIVSNRDSRSKPFHRIATPPTKDLAIATKQLAAMVRTGLPLLEALNIISENSDNKTLKIVFKETAIGISRGSTMVDVLKRYPQVFDDMFVALVSAGETAGKLPEVLERQASLLENLAKIKAQIKTAIAYPVTIFTITILVVILMLIFVIPIFVGIYDSSNVELPALTQLLVTLSEKLKSLDFYLYGIPICIGLTVIIRRITRMSSFLNWKDKALLNLPISKDLVTKSSLANFSRTLSALNSAGVPILESLVISKRTLGNRVFQNIIDRIYIDIQAGAPIYRVLSEQKYIPAMFTAMFRIGEETGELSQMISKLAEFYEDEVSSTVKSLTSILEPLMIVFVSLIVAIILVAMYLPMFKMMNAVT